MGRSDACLRKTGGQVGCSESRKPPAPGIASEEARDGPACEPRLVHPQETRIRSVRTLFQADHCQSVGGQR